VSGHRSGGDLARTGLWSGCSLIMPSRSGAYALRPIDPATADDLVSELFVVASRRLDEIPDDPLAWLLGTARRVQASHRRAVGGREGLAEQLPALHASVWRDEIAREPHFLRALARLSDRDREILLLVAWEDLNPVSAAPALDCSKATFAARLHTSIDMSSSDRLTALSVRSLVRKHGVATRQRPCHFAPGGCEFGVDQRPPRA
jgi:RNA polymerase sigma-70 factor (ECF subfamily)